MDSPRPDGSGFVALDGEIVWQGRRVAMERRRFRDPTGTVFDREFMVHPGAVGVIAVDDVDSLVADGTLVDETTVLGLLLARARLDRIGPAPGR